MFFLFLFFFLNNKSPLYSQLYNIANVSCFFVVFFQENHFTMFLKGFVYSLICFIWLMLS